MEVYLVDSRSGDMISLGSVEEIIGIGSGRDEAGMSFGVIVSDMVADILYDPNGGLQANFSITIR